MAIEEYKVFGPPGCGKTTYTSRQVKHAVEKYGPEDVIVASFTKTAASELAGRDLPLQKEQIGTLHSHCFRALGYPELADTRVGEWNETYPQFALSSGGSVNADDPQVDATFATEGDRVYMTYQVLRAKQRPEDLWPTDVRQFAKRWDEWKKAADLIDFTDMIERAYTDVETAPGAPAIGFFDECQDFTPLELRLVRRWAEKMDLVMLAGDDDQAIYSFKGASAEAFLNPQVDDDHKRVLSQSYRVPRKVQELAVKWVQQIKKREPKEYKPRDEEGDVRRILRGNYKNPEPILEDAYRYISEGKTVMFLTTCSYMLDPIKAVLRQNGLPFHNPYRAQRGDWNPLAGGRGTSSADRLLAFLRLDTDIWGDMARIWTADDIKKWTDALKAQGVLRRGSKKRIEAMDPADEVYSILGELFEEEALIKAISMDLEWFKEHLAAARQKPMEFPLQIAKKYGARRLMDKPNIVLGTIHSVKGGEADAVYLFPDLSQQGMREWTGTQETRDNVIRQFYVGMTRARHTLSICMPGTPWYANLGV